MVINSFYGTFVRLFGVLFLKDRCGVIYYLALLLYHIKGKRKYISECTRFRRLGLDGYDVTSTEELDTTPLTVIMQHRYSSYKALTLDSSEGAAWLSQMEILRRSWFQHLSTAPFGGFRGLHEPETRVYNLGFLTSRLEPVLTARLRLIYFSNTANLRKIRLSSSRLFTRHSWYPNSREPTA